jgi:hypothetical protein
VWLCVYKHLLSTFLIQKDQVPVARTDASCVGRCILTSPWGWRFIAETCRWVQVYVWLVTALRAYVAVCMYMTASTTHGMSNIKFVGYPLSCFRGFLSLSRQLLCWITTLWFLLSLHAAHIPQNITVKICSVFSENRFAFYYHPFPKDDLLCDVWNIFNICWGIDEIKYYDNIYYYYYYYYYDYYYHHYYYYYYYYY